MQQNVVLDRDQRFSTLALILDFALFSVGFAFIDPVVIIPVFSQELAESSLLVGVLTAVRMLMVTLPQLVAASLLMRSDRIKPLLLISSLGGRIPMLVLAIATFFWAETRPGLVVAMLILAVALFYTSEGLNSISWPDIVGKIIPDSIRGRFLGVGQLLSSVGALGAGLWLRQILGNESLAFPNNWVVILLIGFAFLMASAGCIASVREKPEPRETQGDTALQSLKRMWRDLIADRTLQQVIWIQILLGVASTVFSFFVIRGRQLTGMGDEVLGLYVIMQNIGGMTAAVLCGYLIDHVGSWVAIRIGAVVQVLSLAAAMAAGTLGAPHAMYLVAFGLLGFVSGSSWWSFSAYLMDLATPDQRPGYLAVSGLLKSPVSVVSIGVGALFGVMAAETLFGAALVLSFVAMLLAFRLRKIKAAPELAE